MSITKEQAIKNLFEIVELSKDEIKNGNTNIAATLDYEDLKSLQIVLSTIKEKDEEIKELKENINYQTLCDFLISSTSDEEEPVWTEKHIEELLENFEMRWKDAHK